MVEKKSGQVQFRELTWKDANKLYSIYSDRAAMKYRGSKPMESIEDAKTFLNNQRLEEDKVLTIRKGIEFGKQKELIGSVMYRFKEAQQMECEIGYSIGRKFWGQGLGNAIVRKLIETIEEKEEIREVIAWSNKKNIASIKILEKNGFERIEVEENVNNYLYRKINAGFRIKND